MATEGTRAEIPPDLPTHPLSDKQVRRITNLHMVTKPGQLDWVILQVIGELSGGAPTLVELPTTRVPRKGFTSAMIAMFKSQKRFGPAMNLWVDGVISKEW